MLLYKQFPVSIDQEKCSKCRICLSICDCFSYDKEKKIVSVNDISCKGCGVCVASCPSSAIYHIQDESFFYLSEKIEVNEFECEKCLYEFIEKENSVIFCERRFDIGIAIEKLYEGKKIEVRKCIFSDKISDSEKFKKFSKIIHLFGVKND
ncbi:MAG: 4Fe-4S binding protein [Thermoplasmatales archaeon]|nr:4Fe-4S binding protein [Thermoplasmatales archaeon]